MFQLIVLSILGLAACAGNIAFWFYVMKRGEPQFQKWVEQRFQVHITRGHRGHWKVTSGARSAVQHLLIELLQLAFFMGAFVGWAIAILLVLLVMKLVSPL